MVLQGKVYLTSEIIKAKRMSIRKFHLIMISALLSCNQSPGSQNMLTPSGDSLYIYPPVGWKMYIPDGYEILNQAEEKRLTDKGLGAMKESIGEEFEVQPFNNLLNFRKDRLNVFLSTSQVFDSTEVSSYEDLHNELIAIMTRTYEDKKIGVSHKRDREIIDGKEFIRDEFELTTPDNKHFMTQVMYSRLFGVMELSATVTWNDKKYGEEMLNTWKKSTFSK